MAYGPGKFEGEGFETFALYELSLQGMLDEEVGSVQFRGWAAIVRGPLDVSRTLVLDGQEAGYTVEETTSGTLLLDTMAGAILFEDSAGFVSADLYADSADLDSAWRLVEQQLEEPEEEEPESPFQVIGFLVIGEEDLV